MTPLAGPVTFTNTSPPPGFSKVFAPDPIVSGGTSTLTFTIDNSASAVPASSLGFSDILPAGVLVGPTPNAATTCTGGSLAAPAGTGSIGYSGGGSVAAGASCTVTVDVTSSTAGAHVNTSGPLTSSLGTSSTASDTLTVTASTLLITKTPTTQQVVSGSTAAFTITLTNNGTTGISNVQVADPNTADCARGPGVLQAMAAGATQFYTCNTDALTTGFTNIATATASGGLVASASAAVTVVAAQILITKTPATQTVTSGSTATFTITVSVPAGQSAVSTAVVSDPLTSSCDSTTAVIATLRGVSRGVEDRFQERVPVRMHETHRSDPPAVRVSADRGGDCCTRSTTRYRDFWTDVGARFPDLGGARSTAQYLEDEKWLFRRYLSPLHGRRILKTDLWDEAKNTRILCWAAEAGAEAFGVDISPPTVLRARRHFDDRNLTLNALVSDVRSLPFPAASFDAVYSMGTIEHFAESDTALQEIFRVLTPGGVAPAPTPSPSVSA